METGLRKVAKVSNSEWKGAGFASGWLEEQQLHEQSTVRTAIAYAVMLGWESIEDHAALGTMYDSEIFKTMAAVRSMTLPVGGEDISHVHLVKV